MKKYETVIFDLDGTLLYTLEDLTKATNYALRRMNMPERTLDDVRRFVGNGVARLIELAVPEGTAPEVFEQTLAIFREYYDIHCNDNTKAYDGVIDLLRELKAEPTRAVYVGDSEVDLQTAHNAHLPCLSVSWGFRDRAFLQEQGAESVVDTPEELLRLLL